jgi:uncharacterized protein with PIN domain
MKCPYCSTEIVESNLSHTMNDNIFRQQYFCFKCYTLYECNSQSGDMVEENLYEIGEI